MFKFSSPFSITFVDCFRYPTQPSLWPTWVGQDEQPQRQWAGPRASTTLPLNSTCVGYWAYGTRQKSRH